MTTQHCLQLFTKITQIKHIFPKFIWSIWKSVSEWPMELRVPCKREPHLCPAGSCYPASGGERLSGNSNQNTNFTLLQTEQAKQPACHFCPPGKISRLIFPLNICHTCQSLLVGKDWLATFWTLGCLHSFEWHSRYYFHFKSSLGECCALFIMCHVFEDTLLFIQCGLLWPLLLCVDNMMQKFLTATVKCSKCINVRLEFVATTVYPPSKFSSVETCCAHSLKCTLEEAKLIRGTSPITSLLLIFC